MLDCDLEVYINHLDILREDFKISFGNLDNIHVADWLVIVFDMKIDNKSHEFDLEDQLIEMHVDLKAKAMLNSKNVSEYWSNINTATKYTKIRSAVKSFILVILEQHQYCY